MNSNQEELMANAFYNNIEVTEEVDVDTNGIEESEEETITLDFKNMTAYTQPEEKVVVPEALSTVSKEAFMKEWKHMMEEGPTIVPEPVPLPHVVTNEPKVEFIPPARTYKDDIQDLVLNKLASQAVSSLIEQQAQLDIEIDNLVDGKKMGTLQGILSDELGSVIDKRRKELKQCFGIGGRIDFDKIPMWARSYVEDYITNTIVSMCILGDA